MTSRHRRKEQNKRRAQTLLLLVRHRAGRPRRSKSVVSIHAPREECDYAREVGVKKTLGFQFTHP